MRRKKKETTATMSEPELAPAQPDQATEPIQVYPSPSAPSDVGFADAIEEIACRVQARTPLIWVTTFEEERFIQDLYKRVARKQRMILFHWSQVQGLVPQDTKEVTLPPTTANETKKPSGLLSFISSFSTDQAQGAPSNTDLAPRGSIFVLRDFNLNLLHPVPRHLRDILHSVANEQKTIIILSPSLSHVGRSGIEPTLEKDTIVVNYELPDRETIEQTIRGILVYMKEKTKGQQVKKLDYTEEELFAFSRALQGLTKSEIENACAASLARLKRLDLEMLASEKKQLVRKSDILEYVEAKITTSDIGGLDQAKEFFTTYTSSFSPEATAFGVEPLKGVLLVGVPGAGKSLLAKAISSLWQVPAVRLDIGKVMAGVVGGSEERMRQAIRSAESLQPCILWLDEVEKALSGTKSSNFSDAGTLSRVFGTLLTAMQEGLKGVTIIATANDITALPPEFIRRFDEVFFVDLPTPAEREEIFRIHLRQRGRNPSEMDLSAVIPATHMFTGAEIEKVVKSAIAGCFHAGGHQIASENLVTAARATKPLAVLMGDKITQIREWARDRARFASSEAEVLAKPGNQRVTTRSGQELKLDDALGDLGQETAAKLKIKKDAAAASNITGSEDRFSNIE